MTEFKLLIGLIVLSIVGSYVRDLLLARKLRRYSRQAEHIYECSQHEDDRKVYIRARRHEYWLKRSQNDLKVEVQLIVFQEGEHINEDWDTYEIRRDKEIAEDRVKRHKWLIENRRHWYLAQVKGLEGIEC